jgi:hypothetical protein
MRPILAGYEDAHDTLSTIAGVRVSRVNNRTGSRIGGSARSRAGTKHWYVTDSRRGADVTD